MFYMKHLLYKWSCLIVIAFVLPRCSWAAIRSWTGSGGDVYWTNPMNWSGSISPGPADDVILDNSMMTSSFQVVLPDEAITIRTIHIQPSSGRNIELILPSTNKLTDGLTVSGPGYGIMLDSGAIFRNASGITSGESLSIADSLIIHNGARYIHQTRASHANGISRLLSVAPGTELGIFDFDVPRASYTISVSNRVYGCLELHSTAMGSAVNYTCSGANPLIVRGNLRIGDSVSMSLNLSGSNGNIQIDGDFIQEGGQLNLATGTGSQTVLRARGNIVQSPASVITESSNGNPFLELNGASVQEIAMQGQILNQVGFRMNNPAGCILRFPLRLPWILNLVEGPLISSVPAMLILDTNCRVQADSSRQTGTYVDGPLRKLGLKTTDYFLFPVGKTGNLRWLSLVGALGDFTVEYIHNNPSVMGSNLAPALDHISKLEYWTVSGSGQENSNAKIELSFASALCGGVTDPQFLRVAGFQSSVWEDAGQSASTGNAIQGSVISNLTDVGAEAYTLASTVSFENPLPLTSIDLTVQEGPGSTNYSWTLKSSEIPDHFDLNEETSYGSTSVAQLPGFAGTSKYGWTGPALKVGNYFFNIKMTDVHGIEYLGKTVLFIKKSDIKKICWVMPSSPQANTTLMIDVNAPEQWNYKVIFLNGALVKKGVMHLQAGRNYMQILPEILSKGIYVIQIIDQTGENHALMYRKN
jgi:hypothetical protein